MNILEQVKNFGCEQLVFCHDGDTGLKALVAIHDTALGPALGGTRMWPYGSEEEAVYDVLRLARGMTYKAAAAGLPLGGGKAVIWGSPDTDKNEALLKAYGKFIESLGGRYITAEDVGTSQQDMDIISQVTSYVAGRDPYRGGSGDPSPFTARGVLYGIKAAVKYKYGLENLRGLSVAVQGAGSVGYNLCRLLAREGAGIQVADINERAVQRVIDEVSAVPVDTGRIHELSCDIFAPCALGAVINDDTINNLNCSIVAGAANNVLAAERHDRELQDGGIIYVPDYVINAGGVISVAVEVLGYHAQEVETRIAQIYHNVMEVFAIAAEKGITTGRAADLLAEYRIKNAKEEQEKGVHRVV